MDAKEAQDMRLIRNPSFCCGCVAVVALVTSAGVCAEVVNLDTFIRAEADTYFQKKVEEAGGIGRLHHSRTPPPVEKQPCQQSV
jgi:hypothetical protein